MVVGWPSGLGDALTRVTALSLLMCQCDRRRRLLPDPHNKAKLTQIMRHGLDILEASRLPSAGFQKHSHKELFLDSGVGQDQAIVLPTSICECWSPRSEPSPARRWRLQSQALR